MSNSVDFGKEGNRINVGNCGWLQVNSVMGTELTVVNSARMSFNKYRSEMSKEDIKLIHYLINHGHFSTLRHNFVSFTIHMPIFVARQLERYTIGSNFGKDFGWNEVSRRYVEGDLEFWYPEKLRGKSASNKQGSGDDIADDAYLRGLIRKATISSSHVYSELLLQGVAPEMARMVLPVNLMTTVMWSMSLQSLLHFLRERLDSHTQKETMWYAIAAYDLTKDLFPNVFTASGIWREENA